MGPVLRRVCRTAARSASSSGRSWTPRLRSARRSRRFSRKARPRTRTRERSSHSKLSAASWTVEMPAPAPGLSLDLPALSLRRVQSVVESPVKPSQHTQIVARVILHVKVAISTHLCPFDATSELVKGDRRAETDARVLQPVEQCEKCVNTQLQQRWIQQKAYDRDALHSKGPSIRVLCSCLRCPHFTRGRMNAK
eukprot:6197807-Pleurochrysis_carterae.AAC.1